MHAVTTAPAQHGVQRTRGAVQQLYAVLAGGGVGRPRAGAGLLALLRHRQRATRRARLAVACSSTGCGGQAGSAVVGAEQDCSGPQAGDSWRARRPAATNRCGGAAAASAILLCSRAVFHLRLYAVGSALGLGRQAARHEAAQTHLPSSLARAAAPRCGQRSTRCAGRRRPPCTAARGRGTGCRWGTVPARSVRAGQQVLTVAGGARGHRSAPAPGANPSPGCRAQHTCVR